MWQLREFVGALEEMDPLTSPAAHGFVVSRLFVERCLAELTFDCDEYMFYVSGTQEGPRSYLSDIVNFEIKVRSVCGVVGDDDSVFKAMMRLQAAGQPLTAWFHSHPGSGPAASHPSTTDRRQQRNLERLGYHSVGAIFTRDGYVRFFADQMKFEVEIQGNGVVHVDPENHVFQINGQSPVQGNN